ncbi:MAG: Tuberous sclerosis 2-like protein [Thelocarpon impressellum]|nr:MAG: Tuberous sclerosis 2-like protein [Thelocarpon impressellum]
MSPPPAGDAPQTADSRGPSSGIAGVFRHLSRPNRPSLPVSSPAAVLAPSANALLVRTLARAGGNPAIATYGGPANLDIDHQYDQIRSNQPLHQRIAAAEALRHVVEDFSLTSIMGIWGAAKDLTDRSLPAEARQAGFDLLTACVRHSHPTPLERREFFETLSAPCNPDDFHLQLEAMVELTNHGRDVNALESVMMPLITAWLAGWFRASASARRKEKEKGSRSNGAQGEETNLQQLFSFVNDVIRFSFNAFQEDEILALLDQILFICRKTTAGTDIKNSIGIIRALITYGDIPRAKLEPCLEVLCGAFSSVRDLGDTTWSAVSNLCKSHIAQLTVVSLLAIVRAPSEQADRNTNTVRGAVTIADRIMKASGADGLPVIPFSALMEAFHRSLAADSARLEVDVLDAIVGLFEDDALRPMALQEDNWSVLLEVLVRCSQRLTEAGDEGTLERLSGSPQVTAVKSGKERDLFARLSHGLSQLITQFEALAVKPDLVQKGPIMTFFMTVQALLPDSAAKLLIYHYMDEHICFPSNPDWVGNTEQLVDVFFKNHQRPSSVRLLVLLAVKEVYQVVADIFPPAKIVDFVSPLIVTMGDESDMGVLEEVASFAVEVAYHAHVELFDTILDSLRQCCFADDSSTASSSPSPRVAATGSRPPSSAVGTTFSLGCQSPSLANAATKAFVRIFVQSLPTSASKASKAFDALLEIAQSRTCATDARLSAMKLLLRLRCDWAHAVLVTRSTGSETLAASIYRTAESQARRQASEESSLHRHSKTDDSASARSSRGTSMGQSQSSTSRPTTRTTSGVSRSLKLIAPLWLYPDPKALPEDPSSEPSQVLYSCTDALPTRSSTDVPREQLALPVNVWLETLISIIQQGGDWEIYSYVLVHLGSQLTNHALFAGAVPQIKMLRGVLCEQIKASSFHEPPLASGLKKADVTICIFHMLTMLLSYHEHFSKNEQDEVVRTFMLGVGSWERTATCCVHALAVCCHELPLSISKSLNTILQRMSQIITQSHVAVHILEFLGGLARMPDVYVNFREDEYRRVFGICFRYLQYLRDQRLAGSGAPSVRTSYASERQSTASREPLSLAEPSPRPDASEDLPQYVSALAYHVITFWFMSLKLADRSKYITWITKNLISADIFGKELVDEQSLVTMDMMQRVTYSDYDETLPDPHFAAASDGTIVKKSWVVGLSILTVETAVGSGLSQLTKRQPSITTHATYRSSIAPRPLHQIPLSSQTMTDTHDDASRIAVLPNHILLQLTSSSSKTPENMRPIPLPNDDATARALSSLDRNSTVDGHKVGVIYVGEGQTSEVDILANVMGSSDYTEFLEGLGTLIRLKGAKFNTQGLDREYDTDGEFTFCWRDRATEIIFHIATMMPTNREHDPKCVNKKRHTGNDFVNIIWNNSGLHFRFDTFPSDFNFVNIVITPESRATFVAARTRDYEIQKQFYRVQVMSRPGFPEISPAAETKLVSGKSLPAFVRLLALNASVFSLVWANREGGEHVSSWRNRLREIVKLRDRHCGPGSSLTPMTTPTGTPSSASISNGVGGMAAQFMSSRGDSASQREGLNTRRASAATFFSDGMASHRSSVVSTATATNTESEQDRVETESLADGYDFSKWAS